jgi:hypothetical protein
MGGTFGATIGAKDGGVIGQTWGAQIGFRSIAFWQIASTCPPKHAQ